jgi:integrase
MPGHIRNRGKRKDGSTKWQARWSHPANFTTHKTRQFRDKDVAKRWITRMDAEAHGAMFSTPTNPAPQRPFREVVQTWEQTCWTGLSPTTTARYGQVVRTYLKPEFGSTNITDITRERVRLYFAKLTTDGKAPGTVRKVHTVLSAIMSEAVELDIIPANPCTRMRGLPPNRHQEPTFLNASEVRTLADAMPTDATRLLVYMAAYTGLRAGELAGLRRQDVDLLRGVVQVRQALKQLDPTVFGPPKNGKTRTVTLPRFLRTLLNDHLAGGPRRNATAESLVFTSPEGGVLRHGLFMRRIWYPTLKGDERNSDPKKRRKPALPKHLHGLRFHDLRHTAASMLIAQGAHPKVIQERLGHASITTTIDRYGHLFPDHDTELIEGLDAAHDDAAAPTNNVTRLTKAEVTSS